MQKTHDTIPATCPQCGDPEWVTTAVDRTEYDGSHTQLTGDFYEDQDPEKQPIRAFCGACGHQLQLSFDLAREIEEGTETREECD